MRSVAWVLLILIATTAPAYSQIIEFAGSTTVKAYIDRAVIHWGRVHPEMSLQVAGGGSGVGAASVITGKVTIGMMSREPDAAELEQFQAKGIKMVAIGYDAIAAVVSDALFHHGNIHEISHQQLADIYRGRISNWQQLGGPDRQILVIDKEIESGTRQMLFRYLFNDPKAEAPGASFVVIRNRDVKTILLDSDQAIGFLTFSAVDDSRMHALVLREPDGHTAVPDEASIRSGDYPLTRSLYLLVRKDAPLYVHDFIDFTLSAPGQQLLRETGYLPLKE